jgi:hypothetical protein
MDFYEGLQLNRSALRKLSAEILGDAETQPHLARDLIFVLDDPLTALPPQMLLSEKPGEGELVDLPWLVQRHSVTEQRKAITQEQAVLLVDNLEVWRHADLWQVCAGRCYSLRPAPPQEAATLSRRWPFEHRQQCPERCMRSIALGRGNYLFMGSDRGGRSAAIAYTLIETAKLNGVDPQAWLRDVLNRIADH